MDFIGILSFFVGLLFSVLETLAKKTAELYEGIEMYAKKLLVRLLYLFAALVRLSAVFSPSLAALALYFTVWSSYQLVVFAIGWALMLVIGGVVLVCRYPEQLRNYHPVTQRDYQKMEESFSVDVSIKAIRFIPGILLILLGWFEHSPYHFRNLTMTIGAVWILFVAVFIAISYFKKIQINPLVPGFVALGIIGATYIALEVVPSYRQQAHEYHIKAAVHAYVEGEITRCKSEAKMALEFNASDGLMHLLAGSHNDAAKYGQQDYWLYWYQLSQEYKPRDEQISNINRAIQLKIEDKGYLGSAVPTELALLLDGKVTLSRLYVKRAEMYDAGLDHHNAIMDYSASLSLEPDQSSVLRARAKCYRHTGQPDKATTDEEAAARLHEN